MISGLTILLFNKLSLTIILFVKSQNKFISIKLKLYFFDNPSKYELVSKIRLISSFFDKLSKPTGTWGIPIKKIFLSLKIEKKSVSLLSNLCSTPVL